MAVIKVLYTTVASIRSAIGIDENDISDDMVVSKNLDLSMLERLDDFFPNHEAEIDASEATERRLSLWCQYYGALLLIEDATLGIPQKIQANNDQLSRFAIDFEALKEELRRKLSTLENRLLGTSAVSAANIMGISIPTYDPVTG